MLIFRFGARDTALLEEFHGFGLDTLAQTVAQAIGGHRTLVASARRTYRLGVVVEPETYRNQHAPQTRGATFRKLDYSFSYGWSPERDTLADDAMEFYAGAVLDTQVECFGSLLVTPYHVVGGINSRGRLTELRLTDSAVEHFVTNDLALPDPHDPDQRARVLYAGIAIDVALLADPRTRRWLERQYARKSVDGYWVRIAGLHDGTPLVLVRAAADFLFGLLHITGRPVVLSGGGNLHLAFLLSGLSGVCIGLGEGERFVFSDEPPTGPRRLSVHHADLLHNFHAGKPNNKAAPSARAFAAYPCDCGHHDPRLIPRGRVAKLHAYSIRMRAAIEATSVPAEERRSWLTWQLERARRRATRSQLPRPREDIWLAVLDIASSYGSGSMSEQL